MKRFIVATLLALASYAAYAADVNVSWSNATTYTDGSPIPSASPDDAVASTQVQYGTCTTATTPTFNAELGAAVVPWAGASASFAGLPDGTYCFRARHTTVGGVSSNWSVVVSKAVVGVVKKKPRPPTQATITVTQ